MRELDRERELREQRAGEAEERRRKEEKRKEQQNDIIAAKVLEMLEAMT